MAQLISPGVSVTVTDESFYATSAPGTVPLIVVASAENKQNSGGTGTAAGTEKVNSGQVYLITSQRELVDTFGTPVFKTDINNNPIHAGEQNEYGLQAAYSYLGVSNRAYVVRADLDLSQLDGTSTEPTGNPEDGTLWFNTNSTRFGIFEWNSAPAKEPGGQTFTNKLPLVITETTKVVDFEAGDYTPKSSIGAVGDYALVSVTTLNKLWFKKSLTDEPAGVWVEVGSEEWVASWPTAQGTVSSNGDILDGAGIDADTFTITANSQTYSSINTVTTIAELVTAINAASIPGVTAARINGKLELYSTGTPISLAGTSVSKVGLESGKTYYAPELQISKHTDVPVFKTTSLTNSARGKPTGSIWIKTTNPNFGANWIVRKFNQVTDAWENVSAPLYESNVAALAELDKTGGGRNLALGSLYVKFNEGEADPQIANFKIYARNAVGDTVLTSQSTVTAGTYTFTISESVKNSTVFTAPLSVQFVASGSASADADSFITALTTKLAETTLSGNAYASNIVATKNEFNKIVLRHRLGGEIKFVDTSGTPIGTLFTDSANFYEDPAFALGTDHYVGSLWTSSIGDSWLAEASPTALTTTPVDGQLWYNSYLHDVDIMINNGTEWVGYKNYAANIDTDDNGPIISATKPKKQSDLTDLEEGDIWIDVSDAGIENYPSIYRYSKELNKWLQIDTTDQTTENGVVFADARWGTSGGTYDPIAQTGTSPQGTIPELLTSDFVDPDCVDPALYPTGMLLWNLRRSGFNVKRYVTDYIDTTADNLVYNGEGMTTYYPHRWVSEAPNQENGVGSFGRLAQRGVVVKALQALVNSNQKIREEESRIFNLIACPGYPELIDEMVALNYDRGLTAFVIGDTPARLASDATSLTSWGNNSAQSATNNSSGLSSSDEYLGVFYPWGYTSDNLGNDVVVPPSHMMLRTFSLSDNVSYPWFAPAGTRRGGITNATSVGYIDSEGEFVTVSLTSGQRDAMSLVKINPITTISGALVNYGQFTRSRNASQLDRINVARLVVYLRRRFAQLARPYVFEPNDKITRDELKGAAENLLLELVGQRALYDYIVVCDESNNTPARIDRNELYLDIAIEPVKAVEFIYIPLRLKNTGEIQNTVGR
jgi:hypothetical protein